MPSPDVTPYVDLTLLDTDAETLLDAALEDALVKLPEWTPREGNTEVVLLEELALLGDEFVFAVNRLPGTIMEVLLKLYGLTFDGGTAATATATFHLSDTAGHVIPAGTTVRVDLGADLEGDEFTTDSDLVVLAGADQGTVAITSTEPSAAPNGTAAGTDLELLDAISYVESVELATDVAAGADPETSAEFLDRGAQLLRTLVTTLVRPEHFTAAALTDPLVYRATTIDEYDPATGPDPGDNPGHVTVAVLGENGALLSAGAKSDLDDALTAKAQANLAVHVIDPTVTAVAVTVDVVRLAGYTDVQVQDNVTAALEAYLDPDAWDWDGTVWRNELISVIDQAEGVDRVVTLTDPAADVVLAGDAPLANAGAIAVTVQAP